LPILNIGGEEAGPETYIFESYTVFFAQKLWKNDIFLMKHLPRLDLTVLTIRNETWCLWKRVLKF